MSLRVRWTERAVRDLMRLSPDVVREVRQGIRAFATEGKGDVRVLVGYQPQQSGLRVRDCVSDFALIGTTTLSR